MSFSFEILSKMFINIEIITTIFCVTAQHNLSVTERLSNWFLFSFCSFTVSERKLRSLAHFEPRGERSVWFGFMVGVGVRFVRRGSSVLWNENNPPSFVLLHGFYSYNTDSTALLAAVARDWGLSNLSIKIALGGNIFDFIPPKSMPVIQRHLSS